MRAGKLRRYHDESWWQRLVDLKTHILNLRDGGYLLVGLVQSIRLIRKYHPNLIFIKGGFVGVPIGLAARLNDVPYMTHDSDALPGLANRLIARRACYNTVGMPADYYNYSKDKIKEVGIPVSDDFQPLSKQQQQLLRRQHNYPLDATILFITGGSNGARRINQAVEGVTTKLLQNNPNLYIIHQAGPEYKQLYITLDPKLKKRLKVEAFVRPLAIYSGLADLIISRAGATTMAEFAVQDKAVLVVPAPHLSGGHQLKNAQIYAEAQAAVVMSETEIKDKTIFYEQIDLLLHDENLRRRLSSNLEKLLPAGSAGKLGDLLLKTLNE